MNHLRWYVSSVWNDPLPWCVRLSMILLLCGPKVEPRFNRSAAEVAHWRASYFHIFPLHFLFKFAVNLHFPANICEEYSKLQLVKMRLSVNISCWQDWVLWVRAKWLQDWILVKKNSIMPSGAKVTSRINRSAREGHFGELHISFFVTDFHPLAGH